MQTLDYIINKYKIDLGKKFPVFLSGGRRENGLAGLFAELDFKMGVEIGTERGKYAEVLCRTNPNLKLSCIDSWISYENYREHVSQEQQDGFYKESIDRLAPYDCMLIKSFSMDALKFFKDESLDFVYLDANHEFQHVVNDIAEWSKKVRKGGIVSGHDFIRMKGAKGEYMHVKDAVQGWAYAKKIEPWFVIKGDKCPSYFWVKK